MSLPLGNTIIETTMNNYNPDLGVEHRSLERYYVEPCHELKRDEIVVSPNISDF
jgi:hypothetical protein